MLWTFSALLPILVWYGGHMEKHWTKSSTHFHIMNKTYGFLLLMVLVMPSLGLGAVSVYLENLFSKESFSECLVETLQILFKLKHVKFIHSQLRPIKGSS